MVCDSKRLGTCWNGAQESGAKSSSSAHPYAVAAANGKTYTYDANGQMTKRGTDTLTWYSYGLPFQLKAGTQFAKFYYGVDRARYKQVQTTGGTTNATIRYIGSLMEISTPPGGSGTTYRHYVEVRGHRVAMLTRVGTTNTLQYLRRDHEESVTEITGATGSLVPGC